MKHLRLVSDIHLDFDIESFHGTRWYDPGAPRMTCPEDMLWFPTEMESDDDTCLMIAGDLWTKRKFLTRKHPESKKSWMEHLSSMFKYVVFVLGNHDYWDANLMFEATKVKQEITKLGLNNVFLIERDALVLDQVKFVGGTLWTNFNNADPIVMMRAPMVMNDYKNIRDGVAYGPLRPNRVLGVHMDTKNFIFDNAKKDHPDQRVICVTHMAPSYESISPNYKTVTRDDHNHYYYTDMTRDITFNDHDIELWVHGHCHHPSDYMIGSTRVACNPRGYQGYERTGWDPEWRYDLV